MKNGFMRESARHVLLKACRWKSSADYWKRRYGAGGNSGAGSYDRLAVFKAGVINDFVSRHGIRTVIEWGCGDGNQLGLARYPKYAGIDVSPRAVEMCRRAFRQDSTKRFFCSRQGLSDKFFGGGWDLALSLDVIYHLVEDDVYEKYMEQLFASSRKYVCIYSCDFERRHARHVRCRKFTGYVAENMPGWELLEKIPNKYPYDRKDRNHTSWSDFYFYEKRTAGTGSVQKGAGLPAGQDG